MSVRGAEIKRALVTGATGFVGRALCAELRSHDIEVRGAGRHPAVGPWDEFVLFDLRERIPDELVTGVDTVFHTAGRAHTTGRSDEEETWQVNAVGSGRLVDKAKEHGVARFILVSSVKATDDGDRDGRGRVVSPYGSSKQEAEKHVLEAGADGSLHVAVLRPSLIYGPGWKGNLARMFEAVRAGRFPPLPDVGNRRSLVHVDDVAACALIAAERSQAHRGVYTLSDGEAYSTRRIYEAMCHVLGRRVPRWTVPLGALQLAARLGDVLSRLAVPAPFDSASLDRLVGSAWYSADRARRELGWQPRHTLEESLPAIVRASADRGSPPMLAEPGMA